MATLTLGGDKIEIPVMNFRRIKKAYPFFQKAAQIDMENPMASFDDAIEAIRIGLEVSTKDDSAPGGYRHECPISTDEFNERLLGPEVVMLQNTMADMMREAGLVKQKSDGTIVGNEPGAEESPENSTETATA